MTPEDYQKTIDDFLNRNRHWLTQEAEALYLNHNQNSLSIAKCKCDICRYIRHLRQPWYPCPFKDCLHCRSNLKFGTNPNNTPRALLSEATGKAPEGWKFNQLQGLTDEERQCLEDLKT